jgi:hypothetical protein
MPARITRTKGFLKAYAKLTSGVQDRVDIALSEYRFIPEINLLSLHADTAGGGHCAF